VFGEDADSIEWSTSLDIGSLRLTNRFGLDTADLSAETFARAQAEVGALVAPLQLPAPARALATGGQRARCTRS